MSENVCMKTYLFLFATLLSWTSVADDRAQAISAWANFKYPNCDVLLMQTSRPNYFHSIPADSMEKCTSLPEMTKACFVTLDTYLGPKFDALAKEQGCSPSAASLGAGSSTEKVENRTYQMSTICQLTGFTGPTSASVQGKTIHSCKRRTNCSDDFEFYGRKYTSGYYEVSCAVEPGFVCSNFRAIENRPCENASIRELGIFDKVKEVFGAD